MAATQAESQQNDVNLSESVKCIQKRPQVVANSSSASAKQQLDQEPADKAATRGAAQLLNYVKRADSGFEMSQYREDIGGHTAAEVKSPREPQQNNPQDQQQSVNDASGGPGHPASHPFAPNRDYSDEYASNKSNEFSKQHADYPGKQMPSEPERGVHHQSEMEEHYKIEPRLAHISAGPGAFPGQPRFLSGQSISQATGPTPTLNQLLQASSPMHRFHSNYPGIGPESYQQPWPMQRPPVVPPVYPQPGQRPPQTVIISQYTSGALFHSLTPLSPLNILYLFIRILTNYEKNQNFFPSVYSLSRIFTIHFFVIVIIIQSLLSLFQDVNLFFIKKKI